MRLPDKPASRREAYVEVARLCSHDRAERKAYHMELKDWYVQGTNSGQRVIRNKLQSHVRQSTAYLFQSESVRFAAMLPPKYGETFVHQLEAYRDEVHRWWHDTGAGLTVALGTEWGHVYPTSVFKVIPSAGQPHVTLVPDPADVGVMEPDRPFNQQEAKIHFYWYSLPRFRRLIAGHPKEDVLMELAVQASESGSEADIAGATLERIVFDQTGNPLEGGGAPVRGMTTPEAHVEAPRVLLAELWVVDDRVKDYRVVTMIAPGGDPMAVVWDRRNTVVPGIDAFISLTLAPMPHYTWGLSLLDELTGMQQEREEYKQKINRLFDLQLDPPIVIGGFGGLKDDRAERLRRPRGTLTTSSPNVKVERLAPNMPPEAFGVIDMLDRDFADAGGLPLLLSTQSGQGEPGLRAGNQVGIMATLASARIRENAMRVEYAASEIATLGALMIREMHDEPLSLPNGERFLPSQVPREIVFLVASHSASPLYAAAVGDKADRALKAGAIGRPSYIELLDLPMVDVLKAEARRLEEAAAKRQQKLLEIAELKAMHGRSR